MVGSHRKRVLFIASHRPGRAPNQRFRFEQYLDDLREAGFEPELSYLIDERTDRLLYAPGKLWSKMRFVIDSYKKRKKDLEQLHRYDIVFVARESLMIGTTFFEKTVARSPDTRLILDIDDAVWLPNVSGYNASFGWVKRPRKLYKSFRYADLVITGNPYLAEHAERFNPHVRIIPTTIDTSYHKKLALEQDDKVCIGWTGSPTTIPHFELALPVLRKIKEKYGEQVRFKVIGDADYRNEELEIQGIAWEKQREIEDLSDIDIGIMPLPDTEWAKGKCGLKALQYMALEIPPVVSPIGVNREIVKDGVNGFLAWEADTWFRSLERLIENPSLRQELGRVARETVRSHYSVEANRERYIKALNASLRG
ncbi:MAG: glycosyltransferase family 4 protein [Flavobacteriales bacterium]